MRVCAEPALYLVDLQKAIEDRAFNIARTESNNPLHDPAMSAAAAAAAARRGLTSADGSGGNAGTVARMAAAATARKGTSKTSRHNSSTPEQVATAVEANRTARAMSAPVPAAAVATMPIHVKPSADSGSQKGSGSPFAAAAHIPSSGEASWSTSQQSDLQH